MWNTYCINTSYVLRTPRTSYVPNTYYCINTSQFLREQRTLCVVPDYLKANFSSLKSYFKNDFKFLLCTNPKHCCCIQSTGIPFRASSSWYTVGVLKRIAASELTHICNVRRLQSNPSSRLAVSDFHPAMQLEPTPYGLFIPPGSVPLHIRVGHTTPDPLFDDTHHACTNLLSYSAVLSQEERISKSVLVSPLNRRPK